VSKYLDIAIGGLGIALGTLAVLAGEPALELISLVLAAVGFGMLLRDKFA